MTPIFSFTIFISILFGIVFGINYVTYKALASIFALTNLQTLFWIKVGLGILSVSFIVASILSSRYNSFFTQILYTTSATWIGFLTYLFLFSCLYFIILAIFGEKNIDQVVMIGKGLIVFALLVGVYGIYNAQQLTVRSVTINLPNLPDSWKGRTMVFIADTHFGQVRESTFAQRISDVIIDLNPDIVLIGGDLYDGAEVDKYNIIAPFKNINPQLGTYFVMGNHEEYGGPNKYDQSIIDTGISILNDAVILIDGIQLVGVGYKSTANKENFKSTLSQINRDPAIPTILLKHVPLHLEVAEEAGVSLQLSGHTHKAQIFPLNIFTKVIYKGYDYGLKNFGSMQIFTTSGVGTWGPPMRVGSNAEIVHISFE